MFSPAIYTTQRKEKVAKKNTLLCAGLDPASFLMGRGKIGLPVGYEDERLFTWCASYLMAVAPHVAGLKYNRKYWEGVGHLEILKKLLLIAKSLELLIIDDSKIADIGSTNDAAYRYVKQLGVDIVTLAPYAGNMSSSIADANKRDLGIFTMCLMSNPEYKTQKHMLVPVDATGYDPHDIHIFGEQAYVYRYIALAKESCDAGALGVVIGASGEHNHIQLEEIKRVYQYLGKDQLILCPGTGAQGGSPETLINQFGDRVIVCMSRDLMFPEGSSSTPDDQEKAASIWKENIQHMR